MDRTSLSSLIASQGLPETFCNTVEQWYLPLMHQIMAEKGPEPMVIGVQGSQGSGKSTLAQFIKLLAEQVYELRAVELSQDDFYLTLAERQALAQNVHPLFITRGVPGTHDIELAIATINALKAADTGSCVDIPRFLKAIDDRAPKEQWDKVEGKVDLIIFEGWCVGAEPQAEAELANSVNQLEESEDADGKWRAYVNNSLKQDYATLHAMLDKLVVLQAPSFSCVYEWRSLQEKKLAERLKDKPEAATKLMDEVALKRFISHYERLTNHCLCELHKKADWVLTLADDHNITKLTSKSAG